MNGSSDTLDSQKAQQADDQIAQGGHHRRAVFLSDARPVLVEGDIAHPVAAVFDRPMAPVEIEQFSSVCAIWREAGDTINYLGRLPVCFEIDARAFDSKSLLDEWERGLGLRGGQRDGPDFQPAMAFVMLRGEKGRTPTDRVRVRAIPDCP